MTTAEITDHIAALRQDGEMLARAATRSGLGANVPSCPGWQVRDLLAHIGYVHRWATGYVAEQHTSRQPRASETELLAAGPPDAQLIDWFREGHGRLVETLSMADPGVQCWTFFAAPTPLAFWARRQAHETAMHRVDTELASGAVGPIDAWFAADGIDELIMGFLGRGGAGEPADGRSRSLRVLAADVGSAWQADLNGDGTKTLRVSRLGDQHNHAADCVLSGPAAGLYLLLWNRADTATAGVTVEGDAATLDAWRAGIRVRWA